MVLHRTACCLAASLYLLELCTAKLSVLRSLPWMAGCHAFLLHAAEEVTTLPVLSH